MCHYQVGQLPSHTHIYNDAYFAEHLGVGVFGTSSTTDTDNNFYYRTTA